MKEAKESKNPQLLELQSHLMSIMAHAFVAGKSADEVCKVISAMIDSFQYGRIKHEMDKMDSQELWRNSE